MRARTPNVSKFRDRPFDFSDDERRDIYCRYVARDRTVTGQQHGRVLPVDVRRLEGLPRAADRETVLRRLQPDHRRRRRQDPRRPARRATSCTSCATRGRHTPIRRSAPCRCRWRATSSAGRSTSTTRCCSRGMYPDRFHIVRTEDVMADPEATLGALCEQAGPRALRHPRRRRAGTASRSTRSTRGERSGRRRRRPTCATARELSASEQEEIAARGLAVPRGARLRQLPRCRCGGAGLGVSAGRALVTGAGGFVGARLAERLLATGIAIDLAIRPGSDGWRLDGVAGRRSGPTSSICATPMRSRAASVGPRPDRVFHLAAHGAYSWQVDARAIVETN